MLVLKFKLDIMTHNYS